MESIKNFGKIDDSKIVDIFKISKIIDDKEEYGKSLKNWIIKDKKIKIKYYKD